MTFGLVPVSGSPGCYEFPVALTWCSETHLFGGASFGAVVEALEQTAGKPLLSASVQFLERGRLDTRLRIATRMLAESRSMAQARAEAMLDGTVVVAASALLGATGSGKTTTATFPAMPAPETVRLRKYLHPIPGSITDTQDVRLIRVEGHRAWFWIRYAATTGGPMSAPILALLSDQLSAAMGFVMGIEEWWGLTLEGSLRIMTALGERGANDWVLNSIRFDALTETLGQGTIEMWSQEGTLLAVATQSVKPRRWQAARTGTA